ncbi:RNA-binding protein Rsf1-like [Panonychus citri]|uniref:RNA-binding protein Rsf1-like n=1 Tax=Panonychus citri TaxID=50023 RepID=UPI00230723F2|nr:RNA-binding protein Rsf1-like [Panonychus citri]
MTYARNRVFIGGISSSTSKDEIEREFSKYGRLNSVWVAQNPPGFAFVEYEDGRDAQEAVKQLNGTALFDDNKVRVEHSRDRPSGRGRSDRGSGRTLGSRGRGGSGGGSFSRGGGSSFRSSRGGGSFRGNSGGSGGSSSRYSDSRNGSSSRYGSSSSSSKDKYGSSGGGSSSYSSYRSRSPIGHSSSRY